MSLSCYEDHSGSVKGQITQDAQTAFDEECDCAVLGVTDGGMVAFLLNFALKSRRSSTKDFILLLGRFAERSTTLEQQSTNQNNNNNNSKPSLEPSGWEINGIGAVYSSQLSLTFKMHKEASKITKMGKATLKRPSTSF